MAELDPTEYFKVIRPDKLKWLVDYTKARCEVYYEKEIKKSEKPWYRSSEVPELLTFKFTNVKRWLDKETKWVIDNVINSYFLTQEQKAYNTTLFTFINLGATMDYYFGGPIVINDNESENIAEFDKLLDSIKSKPYDVPLQSNAYFLSTIGHMANNSCTALGAHYRETLLARPWFVWKNMNHVMDAWNANSAKEAYLHLSKIPGCGEFMAYQVMTSMSYSKDTNYSDDDYISCGPGTKGGIEYLFDLDMIKLRPEDKYVFCINLLRNWIREICKYHGLSWDITTWLNYLNSSSQVFTYQDWTNAMCEFNKLCKLRSGAKMRVRSYPGQ